jgi:hypothetical protein
MKTVTSEERSTGRGATCFVAVLLNGKFVRVSDMKGARYEGRQGGVENYEVDVADDAVVASFYRSNRGNEEVVTEDKEWQSFEAAHRWAAAKNTPNTCECCGRMK